MADDLGTGQGDYRQSFPWAAVIMPRGEQFGVACMTKLFRTRGECIEYGRGFSGQTYRLWMGQVQIVTRK
jgi:hypothetical protein